MRSISRSRISWVSIIALSVLGAFALSGPATAKKANNPPGANGVVKIDGIPFDQHPDNQPHVSCIFQVDFYNFDQGNYNADVVFSVQPPSGKFRTIPTSQYGGGDPHPFIGEDPAGGGRDVDAQETYDLNMAVFASERHPKQGFHIKLTVTAPGANGKLATKHKVFWASDCIDP